MTISGTSEGGIIVGTHIRKERNSCLGKRSRTVLILPSSPKKRVLKISLPNAVCIILCGFIITVPFLAGVGLWSLHRYKHLAEQSHQLKIDNQSFACKRADMRE
jgi:hypothetical protein